MCMQGRARTDSRTCTGICSHVQCSRAANKRHTHTGVLIDRTRCTCMHARRSQRAGATLTASGHRLQQQAPPQTSTKHTYKCLLLCACPHYYCVHPTSSAAQNSNLLSNGKKNKTKHQPSTLAAHVLGLNLISGRQFLCSSHTRTHMYVQVRASAGASAAHPKRCVLTCCNNSQSQDNTTW